MLFVLALGVASGILLGCVGYSNTAAPEEPMEDASEPEDARDPAASDTGTQAVPEPLDDAGNHEAGRPSGEDAGDAGDAAYVDANLLLGRSARFDGYLMDRLGQPLYMFAEDVAGADQSACLGACAREWPPFDVEDIRPGPGILSNELERFHRQDGRWQATYKGHPLYYRAAEQGERDVSADGVDGRWFVARDYLAFLGVDRSLVPAGSASFDAMFLTNGFGRTLYVCLDDQPGDASVVPVSSCVGECARRRPLWSVSEAERTTILPSVMSADDIGTLIRPDGPVQLVLRGWPVYYFSEDEQWGDTLGQNQGAWRAIDPVGFGL